MLPSVERPCTRPAGNFVLRGHGSARASVAPGIPRRLPVEKAAEMAVGTVGPGLVDCHCHLSASDFNNDLDDVLEKAKKANVVALVAVAEHAGEFERIIQLSERYTGFILPCLGVHPVQELSPEKPRSVTLKDLDVALPVIEKYKDRLLAIGEVGLDFSPRFAGTHEEKEEQRQVLIRQVQLAKRLNVPL